MTNALTRYYAEIIGRVDSGVSHEAEVYLADEVDVLYLRKNQIADILQDLENLAREIRSERFDPGDRTDQWADRVVAIRAALMND